MLLLCLLLLLPRGAGAAGVEVAVPGPGVTLRALLFRPPAGAPPGRAAVIALHACGGIGGADEPIRLFRSEQAWTDLLLSAGHPVIWPDSFGSRGLAAECGHSWSRPEGARTIRPADAAATLAWVTAQPWAAPGGVILMGWSHGAMGMLGMLPGAPPGSVRGAIGFYAGCRDTAAMGPPAGPVLLLLGEADNFGGWRACLGLPHRHPGMIRTVVYPGAHHAFDMAEDDPADRAATAAAAREVTTFLAAHGGPAGTR
ncbi:dienelactone hydrolase family protein [Roseomonas sp. CCTCC AB2023176]|uniref:dienelactone hydrolase family protein n=1 Tax=Roseomonas sp. CCTCC AB2023176 TaxID=3342640 RepID=UPI0035E1E541